MVENTDRGETMQTPINFAAARHLVGLTQQEFGDRIGVSADTARNWESGKHAPSRHAQDAIAMLVQEHNTETARLRSQVSDHYTSGAEGPPVITMQQRDGYPRGWYVALAARLYDGVPVSIELV